jgi:hypothetical protein
LVHYSWYRISNGLCVMRLLDDEPDTRVPQLRKVINSLHSGARAYSSEKWRCLGVTGMHHIDAKLQEKNHGPIVVQAAEPPWAAPPPERAAFMFAAFVPEPQRRQPARDAGCGANQADVILR